MFVIHQWQAFLAAVDFHQLLTTQSLIHFSASFILQATYKMLIKFPQAVYYNTYGSSLFHANRTVWKILIFDFLHFLTFFSTHQKTLPGKFWIFLITGLKDIEFRFFAHNFFKNGPNSIFFFLKFLFFFAYVLEKNTKKNYLKCFYMRFLSLVVLILFLKLFDFFDNFLF